MSAWEQNKQESLKLDIREDGDYQKAEQARVGDEVQSACPCREQIGTI